jgi:hypothetical protein
MHPHLTRLGISPEIQAFFEPFFTVQSGFLTFPYGNKTELFAPAFHLVPDADFPWTAGPANLSLARHVFICSSATEAIAFLACNRSKFNHLDNLFFIATGLLPKNNLPDLKGKQIALVNSNDLLGKLTDIKLAHPNAKIFYKNPDVTINDLRFHQKQISLNSYEKAAGLRSKVRTYKPAGHLSWLAKMEHYLNS